MFGQTDKTIKIEFELTDGDTIESDDVKWTLERENQYNDLIQNVGNPNFYSFVFLVDGCHFTLNAKLVKWAKVIVDE